MKDYRFYTLANGIKVVHKAISSTKIVHCSIFLDIGSRDETVENQGIAHFWEHMAFKGTKKRKAYQILNSLDNVGGELNAYTEKEKIVFYASVRDTYFEKAVDVLSDIAFHSIFPEKEIEKEKSVILEEMAMYRDDPDDSLQDEFEALLFRNHSMGMNILGNAETVRSFKRKDFIKFISNHVDTHRISFSCVGNISPEQLDGMVKKYLDILPEKSVPRKRTKFTGYKSQESLLSRPVKQARCAIGRESYSLKSKNRIPFFMLVNILGGPGMNSRLNFALREKYGFVYSVEAQYVAFSDTGMFAVSFGTESSQLDKCIVLVKKEFNKLCETPLTPRQLATAKEQIKGQLALSEENNLSLSLMMGRSILDAGRVPSIKELFEKINNVDSHMIRDVAQEMFDKRLSYLIMDSSGHK